MEYVFLEYPKCSTCKKAKQWLKANEILFVERHIVEENPSEQEFQNWIQKSGLEIKRFFNTSGMAYRSLGLKDQLPKMSEAEKIHLLASDGMLVKRPLLIGETVVLVGFKEEIWRQLKDSSGKSCNEDKDAL